MIWVITGVCLAGVGLLSGVLLFIYALSNAEKLDRKLEELEECKRSQDKLIQDLKRLEREKENE